MNRSPTGVDASEQLEVTVRRGSPSAAAHRQAATGAAQRVPTDPGLRPLLGGGHRRAESVRGASAASSFEGAWPNARECRTSKCE